ncbi:MAG TPA: lasso peptide biosynthesis B2 protein [Acidobacteriaceae bacterium]|nr:lasso peptide biosynthesis B2 protein [Acidobacteriaceae bacterium]
MSKQGRTVRGGPADWALAAEAMLLLAMFRVALAAMPVRRILGAMTQERIDAPLTSKREATERELSVARRVEWAVGAATRHSPIEFVCFPQTLAGYAMLRRRGVDSVIVYGVRSTTCGELAAHTWLMVGEKTVTGAEGAVGFTVLAQWR